jgi:hypothetical protein
VELCQSSVRSYKMSKYVMSSYQYIYLAHFIDDERKVLFNLLELFLSTSLLLRLTFPKSRII